MERIDTIGFVIFALTIFLGLLVGGIGLALKLLDWIRNKMTQGR